MNKKTIYLDRDNVVVLGHTVNKQPTDWDQFDRLVVFLIRDDIEITIDDTVAGSIDKTTAGQVTLKFGDVDTDPELTEGAYDLEMVGVKAGSSPTQLFAKSHNIQIVVEATREVPAP